MTPDQQKAWDTWTEYCRKLKLYYDATDVTVTEKPELEPWGFNPPPGVVVDGTLAADAELTRLRKAGQWMCRAVLGQWANGCNDAGSIVDEYRRRAKEG